MDDFGPITISQTNPPDKIIGQGKMMYATLSSLEEGQNIKESKQVLTRPDLPYLVISIAFCQKVTNLVEFKYAAAVHLFFKSTVKIMLQLLAIKYSTGTFKYR